MVQIFRVKSKPNAPEVQVELSGEVVSEIVNQPKCQDCKFLVISVNGRQRTGKSFLTNLQILFLKELEKVIMQLFIGTQIILE